MSNQNPSPSPSAESALLSPASVKSEVPRLTDILGCLPDAIVCLDRTWRVTYANAEAVRLSRLQPESCETLTFWQIRPELIGSELERRSRVVVDSARADHFEYFDESSGLWIEMHIMPVSDGIALCYRDVSERKHAQELQADTSQQVRMAFEATPDGVVMIDSQWRFTFANQRALEILDYRDIVGGNIFELFPGNAQEPFNSTYRNTMLTRQPSEFEAFNGEPLNSWFRVQAKPYTQQADEGIIVFFSDISERKRAELREQETARRLAQVLEVTSDAVVSIDRSWRYTYLNANAQKLIDPEKRLIGKNIWEEFPDAVGGTAWELYHRSMHEGLSGSAEVFFAAPINAWLALSSEPTPDGIVVFFRDITVEREQEEIVRGQRELLASVQSVGRLATFVFSPDTGEFTWGPGAYGIYGRPTETITSLRQVREFLLPGYERTVLEELNRCRTAGTLLRLEYPVYSPEGSIIWIENRGQSVAGPDGTVTLRGIAIDVTQRHVDQQDLVASEARYRVLADLNPQAIWMGDPRGVITYANQEFLGYTGLRPADLASARWLQIFLPEDRMRISRIWANCVATGEDYEDEAMIRSAVTGEFRYWHLRAAAVRDASGAVLHWLGVGQDVHETKTYTAALRAEQMETERRRAELESLYTTTPVGLALLDPVHLTFLNLNEQEALMLGVERAGVLGRALAEIASPEISPEVFELLRTAASGTPVRNHLLEGELTTRPGERRFWSVNYSPIFNADGTVRAISTASIEITNQKRAEAALVQSEKLAAVGGLASSISHEINNPLEAIMNLLYLISIDKKLPEDLLTYVQMAQSELSRVSQIATQTLRFHRQAVAPTEVTAADLVSAVIRLYTGRLANSNIKVDARYLTGRQILCFENDIRQILNNLIANAIDAMRTGGRLLIRAHNAHLRTLPQTGERPRSGVRITIADTGHGMSQATLRRIFEPFFTTKDLNGTGLGLWISSGLVERHQGSLKVRSSEHQGRTGTVFMLFLPCEEETGEGLKHPGAEPDEHAASGPSIPITRTT